VHLDAVGWLVTSSSSPGARLVWACSVVVVIGLVIPIVLRRVVKRPPTRLQAARLQAARLCGWIALGGLVVGLVMMAVGSSGVR
jgi:hypothetical protein